MSDNDAVSTLDPYRPLDTIKPVDTDLWIVDGPVVRMRYLLGSLPFSTRMTIVRLADGRLWVHSPIALSENLRSRVTELGEVAWLVAPNRLHWLALAAWQAAFPGARTWAAPGVAINASRGGFKIDATLASDPPSDWANVLDQALVPGLFMTEAVFFHRPTATAIVTDLIENFERDHIHSRMLALMMRIGGVLHPHGGTARDLRLTFVGRRADRSAAAQRMAGWAPRRVIIAHGRIIETDAAARFAAALRWVGNATADTRRPRK